MWEVIRNATKSAAVLLTTHSMEEAETLCDRIGIFMKGRLRCIGTAGDLKQRLGDGFFIHIASKQEGGNEEEIEAYLIKHVPGLELLNSLNGTRNCKYNGSNKSRC